MIERIQQDCEGNEEHGDEGQEVYQGVGPGVISDALLQDFINKICARDSSHDGLHEKATKDGETHEVQSILVLLKVRGESRFKLAQKDEEGC